MNRIEFFGASGIGKSTLYADVCKSRTAGVDLWLTPDEARRKIITENFNVKFPYNRRGFIKFNILKKYHAKWCKEILADYKWKYYYHSLGHYNEWINFLIDGMLKIKSTDAVHKMEFFNLYLAHIEDFACFEYFKINDMVVWDECILRNNPGIEEFAHFQDFYKNNPTLASETGPNAAIYCFLTPEENIKRRKARNSTGKMNPIEKTFLGDDKKLLEHCYEGFEINQKKYNLLKNTGLPILEIDMSHDHSSNVRKVLEYIRRFQLTA